ncbi:hypothetical protein M9978_08420 [Sphingomonas sp. MG17]|uniref:Uncharacterized protein n=1 Tax=Sphingomonas tagetis TaxID=2949092 RepID=A0A9X2KLA7_9SPHN|nr:hypothetical protein [Sphingomonas tagetis]MCP3730452.1 hypothetical protein [Sphingomonas tagetis]
MWAATSVAALAAAGAAPIVLLPADPPDPYQNASPTAPDIYDTGGLAHYVQARGNAQKIGVNNVDSDNTIFLNAPNGDGGFTVVYRNGGNETNLIGYTSISGEINGTMLREFQIERLSPTSNRFTAVVNGVSATITVGALVIGNSTEAGLIAGASVVDLEIGQLDTPLAITDATFNVNRTVSVDITYTGAPDSYEYRLNGAGAWADATNEANPEAGVATITIPALDTGLNGTSPTINLRQKNDTGVTADTSVYVPVAASYGMNLSYPEVGGNGYQVRNGMLYGAWQDDVTNDVYNGVDHPTYIGPNYMPLQMPPTGNWRHLIPFMGPSGTRTRIRANSASAAFSIESGVGQNQSTGSGGGWKWIDYDHTFADPAASDDSAYLTLTITDLGGATEWETYPIDGSGNALESGFFTEQFEEDCSIYECIRFLNWQNTNGNNLTVVDWPDRMTGTDWRLTNGAMPLTRMIELWQACGKDAWFHVPWKATNDYIDAFADLLADSVPTGRKVYIELANEIWNSGFTANWTMVKDEGIALSVTAPGGGTPESNHDYVLARYSQRHAEVMTRVIARFVANGNRAQLVTVCGVQRLPGNFTYVASNYGVDAVTDAYACAAYIGFNANNDPTATSDPAVVLTRYLTGNSVSLDTVMTDIALMKALANALGKRFIAYEGFIEKMTGSSAALQKLVNRDPEMKDVMEALFDAWESTAGDLFNGYRDVMRITDFGGYGQQEYFFQDREDAPKYDALLEAMGL